MKFLSDVELAATYKRALDEWERDVTAQGESILAANEIADRLALDRDETAPVLAPSVQAAVDKFVENLTWLSAIRTPAPPWLSAIVTPAQPCCR